VTASSLAPVACARQLLRRRLDNQHACQAGPELLGFRVADVRDAHTRKGDREAARAGGADASEHPAGHADSRRQSAVPVRATPTPETGDLCLACVGIRCGTCGADRSVTTHHVSPLAECRLPARGASPCSARPPSQHPQRPWQRTRMVWQHRLESRSRACGVAIERTGMWTRMWR
jgi:hypothetical protein